MVEVKLNISAGWIWSVSKLLVCHLRIRHWKESKEVMNRTSYSQMESESASTEEEAGESELLVLLVCWSAGEVFSSGQPYTWLAAVFFCHSRLWHWCHLVDFSGSALRLDHDDWVLQRPEVVGDQGSKSQSQSKSPQMKWKLCLDKHKLRAEVGYRGRVRGKSVGLLLFS